MKSNSPLATLVAALLCGPAVLHAATNAWDGGGADALWGTAANWTNNALPVVGYDLVFPSGAARLTNTNNFSAGSAFHTLIFPTTGYVVSGNRLVVSNGLLVTHATVLSSTVFNPDLTLPNDETFTVTSSRATANLNGTLDLVNHRLTYDVVGVANINGDVIGAGGFTKTGLGRVVFAGTNTYTGTTSNQLGTLLVNGQMTNSPIDVSTNAT